MVEIDFLDADRWSALGEHPVIVADAAAWQPPNPNIQAVCIGVDWAGTLPNIALDHFDVLLTKVMAAPAPWVSVPHDRIEAHVAQLAIAVRGWPVAATILCRVLRLNQAQSFSGALDIESLAYSNLLGGAEFARWRAKNAARLIRQSDEPLVLVERDADLVTLTLNHPSAQNAMTAAMRDALYAALANVIDDPSAPQVVLNAMGKCFSTGGAIGEFGTATNLASAHIVRTIRSCSALLDRLGNRASVQLHGACVGSGLEVPAAAAHRIANADAWFQLPELRMGLIPGAGGTASVSRAIGRHRTAWLVLSGKRIDARQALVWGLVHGIVA
jgi:Enoyl-CoA hydratase/isomerase